MVKEARAWVGVGRGRREQQEKGPRVGPAGEEGGRSAPILPGPNGRGICPSG